MTCILPLLLSALFFLLPLRLAAMEAKEDLPQKEGMLTAKRVTQSNSTEAQIKAFRTQHQKEDSRISYCNSKTVSVIKDDDEATSLLDVPAQEEPSLEAFQLFTIEHPKSALVCLLEEDSLSKSVPNQIYSRPHYLSWLIETLGPEEVDIQNFYREVQKKDKQSWLLFFKAIEREYGASFVEDLKKVLFDSSKTEETNEEPLSSWVIKDAFSYIKKFKKIKADKDPATVLARTTSINDLSSWPSHWTINHSGKAYYATESRKSSFDFATETLLRRKQEERDSNRRALRAICEDLQNGQESYSYQTAAQTASRATSFKSNFFFRLILGQQITAGAYKKWNDSQNGDSVSTSEHVDDSWHIDQIYNRIRSFFSSRHGYTSIPDLPTYDRSPSLNSSTSSLDHSKFNSYQSDQRTHY